MNWASAHFAISHFAAWANAPEIIFDCWYRASRPGNKHSESFSHLLTDSWPSSYRELIGPYEPDPRKWAATNWIDQNSGEIFKVSVSYSSRVKTYGDVISENRFHPEPKCADSNGNVCDRETVGLLRRSNVRIGGIVPIEKESNSSEEVDAGLTSFGQDVQTVYPAIGAALRCLGIYSVCDPSQLPTCARSSLSKSS